MEYILVLDPSTRNHNMYENSHGFMETFADYEQAKAFGEELKSAKDCKEYAVYALCTDQHHLVV